MAGGRHHISAFALTRAPFRPPYTGRWVDKPLRMRLRASTPRVGRANPLRLGGESSIARTTSAFTPDLSDAGRGGVALHGAASPQHFPDERGCRRALVIGLAEQSPRGLGLNARPKSAKPRLTRSLSIRAAASLSAWKSSASKRASRSNSTSTNRPKEPAMNASAPKPRSALGRLWLLVWLSAAASLGGMISPLGDAGRRLRWWAEDRLAEMD